jgi:hypothetical protein
VDLCGMRTGPGTGRRTGAGPGTTSGTSAESGTGAETENRSSTGSESGAGTLEFLPHGAFQQVGGSEFLLKPNGFSCTGS